MYAKLTATAKERTPYIPKLQGRLFLLNEKIYTTPQLPSYHILSSRNEAKP